MSYPTISGFQAPVSLPTTVSGLRYAAGIPLPNRFFRDVNASLYQKSVDGEDGLAWNGSKFRDWYYYGSTPNDAYGLHAGAKRPYGYSDFVSLYFSTTTDNHTVPNFATNHRVLAASVHSGMLPFFSLYKAHYEKAITLAFVGKRFANGAVCTDIKAYLATYSSDYNLLDTVEFDLSGASMPASTIARVTASTTAVLSSGAAYFMLHFGISAPSGTSDAVALELHEVSLMLNPLNTDIATDGSPEYFVDLDTVRIYQPPQSSWTSPGVKDVLMLDGETRRFQTSKSGTKLRIGTSWYREDPEIFAALFAAWSLGSVGLGPHVPEPVPVCIDFGVGNFPFFGYFWPEGSSFDGRPSEHWTLSGNPFDVNVGWIEV